MSYFPIYLQMTGRHCLVVGGGEVAERKVASLLEAGAKVAVISPDVTDNILRWSGENSIEFLPRRYQPGDLAKFDLVFVATDDRDVSAQVCKEGRTLGVWVNAADNPAHCDFILPSLLRRGDLTVAVSSGGRSPALARLIREELELYFTEDYELLAKLAGEVREELRARAINAPYDTWRRALGGEVRQLLMRGDITRAKTLLLREFGVPA
jgi:siroheme synthase-like protein